MDPQQRLLLECTFEALENAGVPKHEIVGKDVGVFIGGSFAEYESHLFRDSDTIPMHQATGEIPSFGFGVREGQDKQLTRRYQVTPMPCSPTEFPTSSTSEAPASPRTRLARQAWWRYIWLARVYDWASPAWRLSVAAISTCCPSSGCPSLPPGKRPGGLRLALPVCGGSHQTGCSPSPASHTPSIAAGPGSAAARAVGCWCSSRLTRPCRTTM